MAPATVDSSYTELPLLQQAKSTTASAAGSFPKPLQTTGALDRLEHFDVTPAIGREYPSASIVDILNAENSDELLRELAITISQRGVVFFRAQDGLTNELQKELILRLGRLTGRPASSGLHIHPILNSERDLGGEDPEISTISSVQHDKFYLKKGHEDGGHEQEEEWGEPSPKKKQSTAQWHSDIAFEKVPADYTSLRLTQLPKTGGGFVLMGPDTLWASGYEIYDRISAPYQAFLESLTATFAQPNFATVAEEQGFQLYDKPRGAPENVGRDLKAVHPVVRTNPVTGWKSIFPVGGHVSHINGVTDEESSSLLRWFLDLVYRNHDLQVRFKWQNPNDIAIWDNRSVFHTATFDYRDQGDRFGNRVVGLGERPFLDPQSTSRRAALGLDN